jgi:uncharacterized protein YcbX
MSIPLAIIKRIFIYPVKSMRGVEVEQAYLTVNGFVGDRRYAFVQQEMAGSDTFPWFTGREKPKLILHTPRFERTPTTPDDWDIPITVETPDGENLRVDDPRLTDSLSNLCSHPVFLFRSSRGTFDSQHVSLFSTITLTQLEAESDSQIDPRQFRANLYIEPTDAIPFIEDSWVGRVLRLGDTATVGVTKKDSRCMMINLDPDTAKQNASILRTVAREHGECAGIYANVISIGVVKVGDTIRM